MKQLGLAIDKTECESKFLVLMIWVPIKDSHHIKSKLKKKLDKILNFIDWIVTFCGGKYMETFHGLRTEIEIQKIGFMLDI